MSKPSSTNKLENLLHMLTRSQFERLARSLAKKGLADDLVGAETQVDDDTLQVVAQEVWDILEDSN